MFLSILLSLCLAHPHESPQIQVNEQTLTGPVIYIADPIYGQVSNRSVVLDPLVLSILPRHANSTFLKGHDDIHVYAGINIKSLTERLQRFWKGAYSLTSFISYDKYGKNYLNI